MATKQKRPEPPSGIRFDADTRKWLEEQADRWESSVSGIVRMAVREARKRWSQFEEGAGPESLRRTGGR